MCIGNGDGCSACHGAGWVTILGAGMVHPKVFETFGFDSTEVSGIAFGLGTTRMMSQSVNAPALRPLYNQKCRFYKISIGIELHFIIPNLPIIILLYILLDSL